MRKTRLNGKACGRDRVVAHPDLIGKTQNPQVGAPSSAYEEMRQYVGAVAVNADASRIAATSPVGGHVLIFDGRMRDLVEQRAIADVCGVAPSGRDFLVSDGRGRLWQGANLISESPGVAWDNHVRRI